MKNQEIAKIFYEVADYLRTKEESFRAIAYRKGADVIAYLEEDIKEIYRKGGVKELQEIPGIGESLAEKIEEFLKTGKIKYYENLKKQLPINLEELIRVEGVGPRKARILYQKLGIKNVKELEKSAKAGKINSLAGFGKKTEKNILEGIEFLKRDKGRFLLGEIMPQVEIVFDKLKKMKDVQKIEIAGSLRRMKETIGDVDFLVVSKKPKEVISFFASLPGIEKVWAKGATKSSVRTAYGFDMDLRVVPEKSFGSALQYFTGSKEHNVATRIIAIKKGLKLNEYGLFKRSKMIAGKTEEEIYGALNLAWMPPEIRENEGEIEAAFQQVQGEPNGLPNLIDCKDIKGDLHCHSDWDGGENSIEEMADYAIKLGYEYIGISDHTKFLRIEHGLNEKQILDQYEAIKKINSRYQIQDSRFRILHGCEANIMPDGSIDIDNEVLYQLDYVIAGVHSSLKMEKSEMTNRIIKAMENPNVDIISHPTGRLVLQRDEYQMDFEKILATAKKTGTILEINASPERLDLKDSNIRKAKESGVIMIINTDAHRKEHMNLMKYGVAQARRGWAEKKDIANTKSLENLLKLFKNNDKTAQ